MLRHFIIGLTTLFLGVLFAIFLVFDRAPPMIIDDVDIAPLVVKAGDNITIEKKVNWWRRCVGEVFRSLIGGDGIIRNYRREWFGPPWTIGPVQTVHELSIPKGLPEGEARYRAVFVFRQCGLTSWWWPLDVIEEEVKLTILED